MSLLRQMGANIMSNIPHSLSFEFWELAPPRSVWQNGFTGVLRVKTAAESKHREKRVTTLETL